MGKSKNVWIAMRSLTVVSLTGFGMIMLSTVGGLTGFALALAFLYLAFLQVHLCIVQEDKLLGVCARGGWPSSSPGTIFHLVNEGTNFSHEIITYWRRAR